MCVKPAMSWIQYNNTQNKVKFIPTIATYEDTLSRQYNNAYKIKLNLYLRLLHTKILFPPVKELHAQVLTSSTKEEDMKSS